LPADEGRLAAGRPEHCASLSFNETESVADQLQRRCLSIAAREEPREIGYGGDETGHGGDAKPQ
jgi:hypothetical protein